ncbi:hypothetical protein GCM10023197_05340 [Gordonia humi]
MEPRELAEAKELQTKLAKQFKNTQLKYESLKAMHKFASLKF